MALLHSLVHKGIDDLSKIQQSIHGKPRCEAALHFLEAMSSHDVPTLEAVFDDSLSYNFYPASLKLPPFTKPQAGAVCNKVWSGVKNFKMIPISTPFEAEGNRVILHSKQDPANNPSTPGGFPYPQEYLHVLTFVEKRGKWLISHVFEYVDSAVMVAWSKALAAEAAAAAAPPPVNPAPLS